MEHFTFFWRTASPFSQWHPARFTIDDVEYVCAEQYMMHRKALLFGDAEIAARILAASEPGKQKALGRKVAGFDDDVWKAACQDIVYSANHAKFTQNPKLLAALLATAGTTLVEASPVDFIWGIGLAADHPDAGNRAAWPGLNLLGEILTRLREDLIAAA